MLHESHRDHRPRRAIENVEEFAAANTAPARAARVVRASIAASAVSAVGLLGFAAPGMAESATTTKPQPDITTTAGVAVEAFAARGAGTDRDAARAALSADDVATQAADRAAKLAEVSQSVNAVAQQSALESRAAGLDAATTKIQSESTRVLAQGNLFKPTAGGITSEWGMRFHPILHYSRMHGGVDMGGACGQPIWAAQDGVVVDRSSGGQSGNNIRLDHGKVKGVKLETAYLHMQSMSVKVGEKVKRGQQIGTVGNTGLSTSCHLHFSTYEDGSNVNPAKFLKG